MILWQVLLVWNVVAFLIMGWDKFRAKTKGWRVPEKTLFLVAFAMGGLGIGAGMLAFHHKTRHTGFRIGVPVAIVFNAALVIFASLK